jgi:hypothetical protein
MAVSKSAKTIFGETFTPSFAASDTVRMIHLQRTLDVYWPVRKMQVAHSESMKWLVEKLRCCFECLVNEKLINGTKNCKLFLYETITRVFFRVINKQVLSKLFKLVQHLMLYVFLEYLLGEEAVGGSVLYARSC